FPEVKASLSAAITPASSTVKYSVFSLKITSVLPSRLTLIPATVNALFSVWYVTPFFVDVPAWGCTSCWRVVLTGCSGGRPPSQFRLLQPLMSSTAPSRATRYKTAESFTIPFIEVFFFITAFLAYTQNTHFLSYLTSTIKYF